LIGARLGPYEVTSKVGQGGMGEVWRGKDPRLERDVALKVLPLAFTADAERLARFEREAKVLASLNHPNIAQIYGLEEGADGLRALVMELVEGPTLEERLAGGALPAEEALELARQIAEALEAAHEKGIVHRDLKPQNVKVTTEGRVKVLDFGLAKAMDPFGGSGSSPAAALANSPTLTGNGTQLGAILGTAAYMSPEQARGRPVDKRADVWAFACVLWEMLTGNRLFKGETVSDTLAAVLRSEIPWTDLPRETPRRVVEVLRRCLERDPRERLRDVGDARLLLDAPEPPAVPAGTAVRGRAALLPWLLAGALAVALGVSLFLPAGRSAAPRESRTLAIHLRPDTRIDVASQGQNGVLAISPDGSRIALVAEVAGGKRLFLRDLSRDELVPVAGSEGAASPFFSPDGRWVAFFANAKLRKAPVAGGDPVELADAGLDRGGVWAPDGTIVYAPETASGLYRIPATGGAPVALTRLDEARGERSHRWPALLPGGREVAFTIGTLDRAGDYEGATIDVVDLQSGARRTLVRGTSMVRVTASGHLLLGREGEVHAIPFSKASGEVPADTTPVLRDVGGDPASGVVYFDVAADGTLAYVERSPNFNEFALVWIDPQGRSEALPLPPNEYRVPRLSPDARRIAVGIGRGRGGQSDIWIYEIERNNLSRLTFDAKSSMPVWTLDGEAVTYATETAVGSLFAQKRIDGSEEPRVLARFANKRSRGPLDYSPSGALLYWEDNGVGSANDLLAMLPGASEPLAVARTPVVEIGGTFSPNGRYVAYSVNVSGAADLYVQAFPGPGGRWQVAQGASGTLRWARHGRELLYTREQTMWVLPVTTEGGFTSGTPRALFTADFVTSEDVNANFDAAPDGRVLAVRRLATEKMDDHVVVALDWLETLRRTVPLR
jgi:serine/threonine-protein kinase